MKAQPRFLLIDDNPFDRALAVRELRREFPALLVKQIIDWQGLAQALEVDGFDLVITDCHLGWSDGVTILRAVKSRHPGCPVIMFTGTGSEEIAVEAMKAGLDDYVIKSPQHYARLAAAVRSALEKVRQRRALQEAQIRYRELFDGVPVGLYRTTPAGQVIDVNPAMVHMLGYPDREALLAINAADLYLNAEDRRQWQAFVEREGIVYNFEIQMRRHDGRAIWVNDKAQAVCGPDGRVLHYEGSLEDVTEQRQAQEALRRRNRELALINRAGRAFNSTLDLDQVLVTVLEEVRRLLDVVACSVWLTDSQNAELVCRQASGPRSEIVRGWCLAPGEGLAGWVAQSGQSLIVPDVRADERHFKGLDQRTGLQLRSSLGVPLRVKGEVIGALQVVDTAVDRFKPSDLALVESLAAAAAIAIENARLYATEQQRITALLRTLQQQQELDRLKDEFVQNVSHELRTPLTIIRGYAEMLAAGQLGPPAPGHQEPLDIIVRRVRVLGSLVEDITAILENQACQSTQESVSMAELIRTSLVDFQRLADQAGLTLHGEIAASVPPVSGNATHLRQVVDNLLSNAVKFTPAGGTVTLNLHNTDHKVVLQVIDTGIGIAPEYQERIFERFYQLNGTSSRSYGGTGLGLALVKEVVETHGGTVTVQSVPGEGSTFQVVLPALGIPSPKINIMPSS